jgi:hypothetical protein
MAEYDIVLQLLAPPAVDREELERSMFDVLRVVETEGKDIALGPVVAVDFEGRLIDLGFNVEADTPAQSQGKVGKLLHIIEQHSDVQFTETESRSRVSPQPVEVCV